MIKDPSPAGFNFAYKIAANISDAFEPRYGKEKVNEFFWFHGTSSDQYFLELIQDNKTKVFSPEKWSLVHIVAMDFLHAYFAHKIYWFYDEFYNWEIDEIINFFEKNFMSVFSHYEAFTNEDRVVTTLIYDEMRQWASSDDLEPEEEERLSFFCYEFLNGLLERIDELVADEVFFLLFHNKRFLFSFSQTISEYTQKLQKGGSLEQFKRPNSLPKWLRRAIQFRDKSSCQRCCRDLSGEISIVKDHELHLDHIIPLEKGGSNDPSNFQVLCQNCNSEKGINLFAPKSSFIHFWEQ